MPTIVRATDPIRRAPRGSLDAVRRWFFGDGVHAAEETEEDRYFAEVYRLAPLLGIDPLEVVGQWGNETSNGGKLNPIAKGAIAWKLRRNPASIGITSKRESDPDFDLGLTWDDGAHAARGQLAHLAAYLGIPISDELASDDPRFALVANDPKRAGKVKTLADLGGEFGWAAVDDYGARIASRANEIAAFIGEDRPVPIKIPAKPNVPKPTIYNLATDWARFEIAPWQRDEILGSKFPNRGGYGRIEFIGLHVQAGKTTGSLDHWATAGVDASSHIIANLDGSLLRIIPDKDGSWTNGDVINPTPEANEILVLGGNPNNWTVTIEREGQSGGVVPKVQFDAILWQVETWIIENPRILTHIWSILRHRFINAKDRWFCPDSGADDGNIQQGEFFEPMVDALNAWLATADDQIPHPPPVVPPGPTTPAPPASPYPAGMTDELAKALYGKLKVSWYSKQFAFDLDRAECRFWLANGKARLAEDGGDRYDDVEWPQLDAVIRRGRSKNVHVYQWSNGLVYEKTVRRD